MNVYRIAKSDNYVHLNRVHKMPEMCQKIIQIWSEISIFWAFLSQIIKAFVIVTHYSNDRRQFVNSKKLDEMKLYR